MFSEDPANRARLMECLEGILNKAQEAPKSKKVQHSNAKNAVLFEAIALIINMDSEPSLLVRACNQLGTFLTHRETNLRYLALESMCLLSTSEFSHEAVKKHQDTIINALKTERDVSVRQRAVDLLYAMCDKTNAAQIVQEMLTYLETADYSIREEMVLKVAILAEKYAQDYSWYVDVILNLIRIAGDYVSEEVWYRVIQIVVNREDVQGYAAKTVFEALQAPACHENMVKVGAYILGEFGNLIAGDPRSSPMVQFQLLHSKYHLCSIATRSLLLSTYVKFINLFPEIKSHIQTVLSADSNLRNNDAELQQRAVEYLALSKVASPDVLATVLEEMPPFPEKESSLLSKLKKKKPQVEEIEQQIQEKKARPQAIISDKAVTNNVPNVGSGGGTADLLGLGFDDSSGGKTSQFNDVFANNINNTDYSFNNGIDIPPGAVLVDDADAKKFVCKNNGVLYESDELQVGVKMEVRSNLARIGMFYGNKTAQALLNFTPHVICQGDLANQLIIQAKPVDSVIEAGAQVQQLINVECVLAFTDYPTLQIQFSHQNQTQNVMMKLPLFINKFMEASDMNSETFFARWKALSQPEQESQKIYKANFPMDTEQIKTKLLGFGVQILSGIDPNPSNFVCASIIHCRGQQVGCLVRLEPNEQAQMYRLTVRTSRDIVSIRLCDVLSEVL